MKLGPAQAGGNVLIFKLGEPFGWECPGGAKGRATRRTRVGWRIPGPIFPIDVICGRFCTTFERLPFNCGDDGPD